MLFQQRLLLVPPLQQPGVEVVGSRERDVGDVEAAPVHVDGGLGVALEVGGAEGEDVLAVLSFSVAGGKVSILLVVYVQGEWGFEEKRFGWTYGTPS